MVFFNECWKVSAKYGKKNPPKIRFKIQDKNFENHCTNAERTLLKKKIYIM